ncbi:MAG: ribose 5-phosphate isomerase B [Oscillospiraceae bacterium]|nr:ribose 5-phosphate isomerase B [Oscillospiraceae bacterium]
MIAIASDHRGYKIKEGIKKYFNENEIKYIDFGTNSEERTDYPKEAKLVALSIQKNECEKGILICGTGLGMSIVANKFKGIRCAVCSSETAAKYSRLHNNSNILALGAGEISSTEVIPIVKIWLGTEFEGGRHAERLKMIEEIESENFK